VRAKKGRALKERGENPSESAANSRTREKGRPKQHGVCGRRWKVEAGSITDLVRGKNVKGSNPYAVDIQTGESGRSLAKCKYVQSLSKRVGGK